MTLVSEEKVFESCNALAKDGQSVTVVAVRTLLGGGSMSSIAPIVKKWKSLQKSSTLPSSNVDIPPMPTEELGTYLAPWWNQLWRTIYNQANERIAAIKAEAQIENDALLRENDRLREEMRQHEVLIDELSLDQENNQLKLAELNSQAVEFADLRGNLEQELNAAKSLVSELQHKVSLLTEKNAGQANNIDLLNRQSERLTADLEKKDETISQLEAQKHNMNDLIDRLKVQNAKYESELAMANEIRSNQDATIQDMHSQLQRSAAKCGELESLVADHKQQVKIHEQALARADSDLENLESDLEHALNTCSNEKERALELAAQVDELKQSIRIHEATVSSYGKQNSLLENQIVQLNEQVRSLTAVIANNQPPIVK